MENTNYSTSGKVIIAAVAGVAVGAILGILFAPDKGSETRSKLVKKAKRLKSELKHKFTSDGYAKALDQNVKRPPLI